MIDYSNSALYCPLVQDQGQVVLCRKLPEPWDFRHSGRNYLLVLPILPPVERSKDTCRILPSRS